MEIRRAKNLGEVEAAYELAARIFGPNYFDAKEVKNHIRALEPLRSLGDAIIAVDSGSIVGFIRIVDRQLYSPVGMLKAGGITSVCVHPDLQGHGLGRRLMEMALRRLRQRKDILSILFARRALDGWYTKYGYVGIGCHPQIQIAQPWLVDNTGQFESFNGRLQRGIIPSAIDLYAAAYADSYQRLFLSFYRDDYWWQTFEQRLWRRVEVEDFINVIVGDIPVGYFILKEDKVIEAASLHGHRADVLASLLEFWKQKVRKDLKIAMPLGHWCARFFKGMNHIMTIRYAWDGGHMVRFLNKDVLKEILIPPKRQKVHLTIEKLFGQFSLTEDESASKLLSTIAGAVPTLRTNDEDVKDMDSDASLLPAMPTWSIVDEL